MKNNICIYIHWPWCDKICKYCDYYKFKQNKIISNKEIYNCFVRDLSVLEEYLYKKTLVSVHIGGGTPSIMNSELLAKILEYISKKYKAKKSIEVSIEANPARHFSPAKIIFPLDV